MSGYPSVTLPFTESAGLSPIVQPEYNSSYLQEWGQQIQTWLQEGKEIYFFVHCPIEEHSPHPARHFQRQLQADGVRIPPLPWDNLQPIPKQLSLF